MSCRLHPLYGRTDILRYKIEGKAQASSEFEFEIKAKERGKGVPVLSMHFGKYIQRKYSKLFHSPYSSRTTENQRKPSLRNVYTKQSLSNYIVDNTNTNTNTNTATL